jgi:hypothetical protein
MKWARPRFLAAQRRAEIRDQAWHLTFDEWYSWWLAQGLDQNYTPGPGADRAQVMAMKDPELGYCTGNLVSVSRSQAALNRYHKRS